tara:strand:+ start:1819 stop:2235 length:417 start_codon:yes stop_codon:yes gene_type:complete
MKNKVLLFAIVLCSNSCENPPFIDRFYGIIVINNSSGDVYVHKADLNAEKQYPDTLLPSSNSMFLKIPANKRSYFDSKTTWEENIKNLPSDTLSVFFIDGITFENEEWETIRDNYNILKRYDFSIEDLEKSNFTIVYP